MWGNLRLLAASAICVVHAAAQDELFEQLPLRVSSVRPGGDLVVDRGRRDLVQAGDRVVFVPRNGQVVQGAVVEVDDRTALVEVVDRNAVLPIGTKGHLLLPKARRTAKPVQVPLPPSEPPAVQNPPADEWRPGMPLLGTTRPPRPSERPRSITGRVYGIADVVRTLDSWSHSFLTAGTDFEVENAGGDGGVLHFHGEFDWSTETSEQAGADLRLYEFSYERGGTRFDPVQLQIGRFLPRDMPEFGLLDGAAVGFRREGGDRMGASFGYLPELDEDLESFADLQIAAWYVWNADVTERVSFGLGYQKSWHRFEVDRDLVVAKARYLPIEGWDVATALWIDFYSGRDAGKDAAFGVTRANFFTSRRWEGEGGLEFAYDHEEYPEMLRRELPQTIAPATLLDAHQDRLSLHAFLHASKETRWFARGTGWIDEQRQGGAVEVGVEFGGLLGQGTRTGLAGFDVQGATSTLVGVRLDHGGTYDFGRLDLLYELGFVHHEGFPDDRDDLLQHRIGVLLTTDLGGGWDCTCHADGTLWDDELSLGVGIYLQRHF